MGRRKEEAQDLYFHSSEGGRYQFYEGREMRGVLCNRFLHENDG